MVTRCGTSTRSIAVFTGHIESHWSHVGPATNLGNPVVVDIAMSNANAATHSGALDALSLNTSGLAYEDYNTIQAAWPSTTANPEGVVRTVSSFGYTYMVPLPVVLDHPMWNGTPPGPPSASQGQDHNWIIAAQNTLNGWNP